MHLALKKLLTVILFFSLQTFANEEAAKPEPGGGEEKKTGAVAPEWVAVEAKIALLEAKVRAKETSILQILEEKKKMENGDPHLKDLVLELQKEHREMRKNAEELEKEKTILRYRFPERAADPNRHYKKIEVKSLDEMEAGLGVDGHLLKSLAKAKKKYQVPDAPEKPKKATNTPKPTEQPLILQK